jgi:hypothetical protein
VDEFFTGLGLNEMCGYPVGMKKNEYDASTQIAQLRLSLDHVTPRVARVVAVPFEIRLDRLHLIFQASLGWSRSHLYVFESRGIFWGDPVSDAPYYDVLPSSGAMLADLVVDAGASSFKYVYNFGDEWRCSVKLQALTMAAPRVSYPLLLAASGRTPPEDIGGPTGYEDYLMALCDPSHKHRSAYSETYGLDFDPAVVDIAQIDRAIAKLAALPRPTRNPANSAQKSSPAQEAGSTQDIPPDVPAEAPKEAPKNKKSSPKSPNPKTPNVKTPKVSGSKVNGAKVNGAKANAASQPRASKAKPPKSDDA